MACSEPRLKPMGLFASILYFGIPAALFAASILGLLPWMIRHGHSQIFTFFTTFGLPLGAMLAAAFVFYRLEGRPWTWAAFRDRMRLRQPTARDWIWTLGLILVTIFAGAVWAPVVGLVPDIRIYTPPAEFVTVMTGLRDGTFGGMAMSGRWDIFAMMAVCLLVFNIFGEELWWRGIILPRQELVFGKWTWLLHGVLWNLFHFFYHSSAASIVSYMIATIPISFVAQQTRNTWPGVIAHSIANSAALTMLYKTITG